MSRERCQEHDLRPSPQYKRGQLESRYAAAEWRYIAAVATRKAAEEFAGESMPKRAEEQFANAALVRAREALEAHGYPVNSSPILALL